MPLCLICQTDYELIGSGHPPYPCDCGENLGEEYRRDYEPGDIEERRRRWQDSQQDEETQE